MPLEATGADDRWKWCSYELGRWDGNLGRSEQMPVNLDSNFRGEVKEARRLELRSSGHAEAMDNDFGARGRLEGYDSGGLAHPNIQLDTWIRGGASANFPPFQILCSTKK
jgi:hypothetical protein